MDLPASAVGRRHQDIQVVQALSACAFQRHRMFRCPQALRTILTFTLASHATAPAAAPLTREVNAEGRGRMTVRFGREGIVRWINDPEIGDRIAVALLAGRRVASIRGAQRLKRPFACSAWRVIEPRADDVSATFADGVLTVSRGEG
jgi:hypothetical protein